MAIDLVMLTYPDGHYFAVQPSQVAAIHEVSEGKLHEKIHCVVFLTNGKFYSVLETCPEVSSKLRTHGVVLDNPQSGPSVPLPKARP